MLTCDVPFFAGLVATRILQLKPFDHESDTRVEMEDKFLETSLMQGRVLTTPEHFKNRFRRWLSLGGMQGFLGVGTMPRGCGVYESCRDGSLPQVAPVTSRNNTVCTNKRGSTGEGHFTPFGWILCEPSRRIGLQIQDH